MYKPPIEIFYGEMQTQLEGDILKAVQKYDIVVDKDELLRALQYDRGQYYRGYDDGRMDAMKDIVHCCDCHFCDVYQHSADSEVLLFCTVHGCKTVDPTDFCSRGERRTDNG